MVKTVMIPNGKSNIAYADRVDWERAVERSCKRNLPGRIPDFPEQCVGKDGL